MYRTQIGLSVSEYRSIATIFPLKSIVGLIDKFKGRDLMGWQWDVYAPMFASPCRCRHRYWGSNHLNSGKEPTNLGDLPSSPTILTVTV